VAVDATETPNRPPDELAQALTELTHLMLATPSVEQMLDRTAVLAGAVIRPPASCGITVNQDHQPYTIASSGPLAAHVDEVQYGAGDGPCLQTLRTGKVVPVVDMATERRWGSYPAYAMAYGVRSSLSLPLRGDGTIKGALNLYATSSHAFDDGAQQRAELFTTHVSAVLTAVARQARQVQLSDQLRGALAARTVIDQAVGIIMEQQHCDAARAFDLLREASQHQNRKLREIATEIVTVVGGGPPLPPAPFNDPS
jgi:GAF domain-containing protein